MQYLLRLIKKYQEEILVLSLIINFLLLIFLIYSRGVISSYKMHKIDSIVNGTENTSKENQELDRMNGVLEMQKEDNVTFNDVNLLNNLQDIKFSMTRYNYEATFDRFTTNVRDINISIEKIKNESPFLVIYPSEWLGVRSISRIVEPIINDYDDKSMYNENINGVYFIKDYRFNKPSCTVELRYETVQTSNDYVYYITFSTSEGICSLDDNDYRSASVDPKRWFSANPSEKFEQLENFMNNLNYNGR